MRLLRITSIVLLAGIFLSRVAIAEPTYPQRIVSLAPSITEILYALDLDEQVVGVTRYCVFPPAVEKKPKVGGLLDPSYEAIVALQPDLVMLSPDQAEFAESFKKLNIESLEVPQYSLDDVLSSILLIGQRCGKDEQAQQLKTSLENRIAAICDRIHGKQPTRALVTISRSFGARSLGQVYVAGQGTFYDTLLEMAGGKNAVQQKGVKYPVVTAEGILRMNPEVILEIAPGTDPANTTRETLYNDWWEVKTIDAYRHNRIYVYTDSMMSVPGPRIDQVLDLFVRALHPESDPK